MHWMRSTDTSHLDDPEKWDEVFKDYRTDNQEPKESEMTDLMRVFDTGATRDSEDGKLDYEGFLSPYALRRYAKYMHAHRTQTDGEKRDSDNWQKGIPLSAYVKSLWRHVVEFWTLHREDNPGISDDTIEEALCAIIFNASGYLHEILKPGDNDNDPN